MPSPLDIAKLLSKIPWKAILQRMLGVWNIGFIIFCFIGPVMYPILYSAYFIILHVIFAVQNVRNYIGSYNGYHQCVKHSKTDWAQRYCDEANVTSIHGLAHDLPFGSVNHIIIVPNYLESMETLIDTLDVLASHDMALTNYIVCLAMEETEYEATRKGDSLVHMYRDSFLSIVFTLHPSDTAGEVRGKSSNVGHAAKIMAKQTSLLSSSVFTIIDADTCFSQDYFTCLSYHFAIASPSDRQMMLFSPCTVFDRFSYLI